jgi:CBS domain-containing protein
MAVRDIMVPRAQMDVVDINDPPEQIVETVLDTAHSRFPAIGESKDDVLGILLAKDLLRYFAGKEFDLRDMLRPAVFIPESKRLNVLLREFRASRNHMAIVVDEYGGVAGLVTIEDVLEQIVGDIEDEYDFDETADNIVADNTGRYRVKALTEIADFNAAFATELSPTTISTPSAAWSSTTSGACPSATKSSPSTACACRCCAPTAAACIPCWSTRLVPGRRVLGARQSAPLRRHAGGGVTDRHLPVLRLPCALPGAGLCVHKVPALRPSLDCLAPSVR